MCRLDVKVFLCTIKQKSRNYVIYLCSVNLYKFIRLCLGLGAALPLLTKLLRRPVALLRQLKMRVIIYHDDTLVFGRTMEEAAKV